MSIKNKIKIKKMDRDRGTYLANGISLDLSDDGQPSDDSRRSKGESTVRDGVSQDDNVFNDKTVSDDYKSGGAYKAILSLFAEQLDDEKFAEHCKKFFKGEESGEPSGPAQTMTQKQKEKA